MTAHAAIHVGLKQLGIEGDDKRDLYRRVTGEATLTDMSPKQQRAVVDELRRLGFKPALKGARKQLQGRFAKKLQALWIAGWNLGIVRNRDDEALIAFVKRQTGIDHVRFLHYPEDARKAIDALKSWLAREAGVDWSLGNHLADWQRQPGFKVAVAQWQMLDAALALPRPGVFTAYLREAHGFRSFEAMTARDWQKAMNALGVLVRTLPGKAG
ncbi:MAG: regulatory protein GemA [Nitratireductor sp.]|uniref:regulatory protein GemA n=1 Tax=Parvibaculum sp. TaxID=2024848 RepID=UPI00326F1EE3